MKHILKLAYKLGTLSNKAPKLSTKPFKAIINEFKPGRVDSKPKDITNVKSEEPKLYNNITVE